MSQRNECSWVEIGVHLPTFRRNIWLSKSEIKERIISYGEVGLYTTAYSYKEKGAKEDEIFGHFYLDFDSDDFQKVQRDVLRTLSILRVVFRIDIDSINIFFSGKKGIHVIVPADILGIEPKKQLNDDFKAVAKGIYEYLKFKTLDLKIYDNARLLRLPNTRHQDTGYYKIALTEDEVRNLTYDDIATLATQKRKIQRKKPLFNSEAKMIYDSYVEKYKYEYKASNQKGDKKLDYTPPCIRKLWTEGVSQGERNHSLAALVSHFYQLGHEEEKAHEWAIEWATERCNPPLSEGEIQTTVRSIYTGGYRYGCQKLSELAGCYSECRFYSKRGSA